MDKHTAIKVAQNYSRKIISGDISPYDGAKSIVYEAVYKCNGENECPELNYMSGLEDEYLEFQKKYRVEFYGQEKTKENLKNIEKQIIDEANDILKIKV